MRSPLFILMFLFCSNLLLAQTELKPQEALLFKERVVEAANKTETISSDFVQKKHLDFLENDIETFGKMAFQSPNMIKWEYTAPFVYSVIFKNDKLYVDNGGNKNEIDLSGNDFFQSLNDLIAKSVKGDLFDDDNFDIQYFKLDKNYRINFLPKRPEMNAYIKSVQLTFDDKTAQVIEVKMIESSDDYTHIVFKNRAINSVLDEAIFKTE